MKKLIFCQGDKKELEEITSEKFEYINCNEIKPLVPHLNYKHTDYSRNTFLSFIELYNGDSGPRTMKRELYKIALKLNADAFIHYTESYFKESSQLYCVAKGTPLRKSII